MANVVDAPNALAEGTIQELRETLRGEVLAPSDPSYDEVRTIWNGMFDDVRPALIVRCAGAADVTRAVQFGTSENLEIAVRSGGHSIPGLSATEGGLLLDLRPMAGIRVDPAAQRAVVQPGATWGDFDAEAQAFGLATTGGLVSTTGVAGFTLGGGIGWLVRKYGMACDNLVAADLVTADGRLLRAGEGGDPELLWGLRGGGGNLGVVTALEFELHPVGPTIMAGPVFFPGDRAEEVLAFFSEWTSGDLPDELSTVANLTTAPPVPFLPEDVHGKPVIAIVAAYAGSVADGEAAVAPLKALADPIADLCGPIPYAGLQSLLDPLWEKGARNHMKAGYLRAVSPAARATLIEGQLSKPSPNSELHIHHLGGAAGQEPEGGAAFPHRDAPYVLNVISRWMDPATDDAQIEWGRGVYSAIEDELTGGAYINFLSDEGQERVQAAYGDEAYARLQALKQSYDPENVFHRNQNVAPAGA